MADRGSFSLTDRDPILDDEAFASQTPDERQDLKKRHAQALSRFKSSSSAFTEQRRREVEDLKFVDFGEQWDPQVKTQRQGGQAVDGQAITPPRPAITVDQLRGPGHQIASVRRQADIALDFISKGAGGTDTIADAFEDIARAIQQDSRADVARNWAADRAEHCGLGWYRIDTQYKLDDPGDEEGWNDQDIVFRRILNQASVYPDYHAQEPDFSDGRYLFQTEDMPWDDYKDQYGESYLAGVDGSGELTAIGDTHKDWIFDTEGDGAEAKTVRVAEYWEVVTKREWCYYEDGEAQYVKERADVPRGTPCRLVNHRTLMWSKINAVEFLEGPQEWNGQWIPLIPVIGEESNVDGERRWTGYVRPAREACVSYNVMRSALIEAIALQTKAPYIGYWKTIEKFQQWWKQSNVRNFFILPVDEAYDKKGDLLPPPVRNAADAQVQAIVIACNQAKADIQSATGITPVALGDVDPTNRSGAAIKALQGQSELGTSIFLDNLKQITIPYEGKVLGDLIPRIYDREGRQVAGHTIEKKRRLMLLKTPYVTGPQGSVSPASPDDPNATTIDLSKGEYAVTAVVGKSYPTQKREQADYIGNLMQATPPEFAMALTPALIEAQDFKGHTKLVEIAIKALPPPLQAAYSPNPQAPDPQMLMQQLQQMQGQMQQLQQQANDNATKIQVANINAQASIQRQQLASAATITIGQWKADAEGARTFADGLETLLAHEEHFASLNSDQKKQAAASMATIALENLKNTHATMTQALDHSHDSAMAAQNAQHAQDAATTAAALAPPPTQPGAPNA